MKNIAGRIVFLLLKLLLVCLIAAGLCRAGEYAYKFGEQIYSEEGVTDPPGRDTAVVIYEGETVKEIAEMLKSFHLIDNPLVFQVQERLSEYHGQIQPGNYVLNTSMSGSQILAVLSGHPEETQ